MNNMSRIFYHLVSARALVKRYFHKSAQDQIARAVLEAEALCDGEVRVVVEAGLTLSELLQGVTARERAESLFAEYRVWDTEHNNGILLYVLFADRKIEIVADRGLKGEIVFEGERHTITRVFEIICERLSRQSREKCYVQGIVAAVTALGLVVGEVFPKSHDDINELPNEVVLV